ncbi:AraC family transcriptional regulator [Clostridium isatidis]|uniref:AraC family transcriptional regulator n=1 Tax=Clostridium isatidis TaxID=182773 RepID=UPI003AAB9943
MIYKSDILNIFKEEEVIHINYVNDYEPFEKEGPWKKDLNNICVYNEWFSTEKKVVGKHWHESLEIIYVVEGSLEITTANENILLGAGDVGVIGGSILHGTKSLTQTLCHQCLHIRYDFLVKYLDFDKLSTKAFKVKDVSKFLFYYKSVIQYLDKTDYVSRMKYQANLLLLLTTIVEDENFAYKSEISSKVNDLIHKVIYYINCNYKENITLNSIAKYFGYTPQNIALLFKKYVGKTVYSYLTEIRLENAVYQLVNSKKNIIEIALECGFPNEMAFINKFKAKYKTTPSNYRKQVANKLK